MKMSWYVNDRLIQNNVGISVGQVNKRLSTLSIDSVRAENAGTYTCTAENMAGSANYSTYLHVNGIKF